MVQLAYGYEAAVSAYYWQLDRSGSRTTTAYVVSSAQQLD